jgi:phenylalanyl-tRNA synthetase alpha chain
VTEIESLQADALAAVSSAESLDALETARVTYTGKRSELARLQREMRSSPGSRPSTST